MSTAPSIETTSTKISWTPEEIAALRSPRIGRLVLDLGLIWVHAAGGCAVFILHPAPWTYALSLLLVGAAQHRILLIPHECIHGLLIPGHRRLNDWIGANLFAAAVLLPYRVYRQRHMAHHRLVSTAEDTKFLYRRDLRGWRFLLEVVFSLSMLDYFLQVIRAVRRGQRGTAGGQPAAFRAALRRDLPAIAIVQGLIFAVFLAFDPLWRGIPTYYGLLWIGPLLTTSYWFGKLRSAVEHQPFRGEVDPASDSAYFMGAPAPTLRSVRATRWERLCFSATNFHFHAEHHLWPWISYQHLPAASRRIWGEGAGSRIVDGQKVDMARSYASVLARLVRGA